MMLTCKMCGSADGKIENGMYSCNACGTKFLLHNFSANSIGGSSGLINSRNSSAIDTIPVEELLTEARAALQSTLSGSKEYAEDCCKRAFSKAPNQFDVLEVYAIVLLNTTTIDFDLLSKLKIIVGNCPEEKRHELILSIKENLVKSLLAKVNQVCANFESGNHYAVGSWADELYAQVKEVYQSGQEYSDQLGLGELNISKYARGEVFRTVERNWNRRILPEYKNAGQHPDEFEWGRFKTAGLLNVALLETIADEIGICDSDDIPLYELLCEMVSTITNSCSWEKSFETKNDWATGRKVYRDTWKREYELSGEAQEQNKARIQAYMAKIKELTPKEDFAAVNAQFDRYITLDSSIKDAGIDPRVADMADKLGIKTVGQFLDYFETAKFRGSTKAILDQEITKIKKNLSAFKVSENTADDAEIAKQEADWMRNQKCRHCGGAFGGVFSKKCKNCGKLKDYF